MKIPKPNQWLPFVISCVSILLFLNNSFSQEEPNHETKPLSFKSTDFPVSMIILKQTENDWLKTGDIIYSIYQNDNKYFACWGVAFKSESVIIKAFRNDDFPVKTGFSTRENIVWGLWRGHQMKVLQLKNYDKNNLTYSKATLTDSLIVVLDNQYYSLDPVWPAIDELEIAKPIPDKEYALPEFMTYRPLMPKYTSGSFSIEIIEGEATVNQGKTFNACKIRMTETAVKRGFIRIKIKATALTNSRSENTAKVYRIWWK